MNAVNGKKRLVVVCLATVIILLVIVLFDRYAAYPYSTHMALTVDMPSVSKVHGAWFTTNDFVVDRCVKNDDWDLSKFEKMTSISTSRYTANVSASMKRSFVFGRNRGLLWRGRILVLAETNGAYDAYLIDDVANRDAIQVAKEHQIVSGAKVRNSQR